MIQKELGQNSQHNQLIIHLIYESVPDTYPITVFGHNQDLQNI